jgi:heme O synthase-like polyprenyltransferase
LEFTKLPGLLVTFLINYWIYTKVSEGFKRETMYLIVTGGIAAALFVLYAPSSAFLIGLSLGLFIAAWILAFMDNFRRGLAGED